MTADDRATNEFLALLERRYRKSLDISLKHFPNLLRLQILCKNVAL